MSFELHSDIIPALITKYLLHQLLPGETELLQTWIKASPHNWFAFYELTSKNALEQGLQHLNSFDASKAFQKISSKLGNL